MKETIISKIVSGNKTLIITNKASKTLAKAALKAIEEGTNEKHSGNSNKHKKNDSQQAPLRAG